MLEKWKSDMTMKTIKCIMLTAALLSYFIIAGTVGAESGVVTDPEDDVFMTRDLEGTSSTEKTDERPNVDIVQVSYNRIEGSTEVTVTLEVNSRGEIEDRNDLEDFDMNSTSLSGSVVTYGMYVQTTETEYNIQYINENLTINFNTGNATVSGNELIVTFDLENVSETITNVTGTSIAFDINSITDMKYYFDIAPDESLFMASATASPSEAETGEEITFSGEIEDLMGVTSPPYDYSWDFDDGTTATGQNPTHSYDLAGDYIVELTVEDGNGETTTATTEVTITKGSGSNGGTNGDSNGDDSADSGLFLFVGIIAIIVIIGIIALVYVIRR